MESSDGYFNVFKNFLETNHPADIAENKTIVYSDQDSGKSSDAIDDIETVIYSDMDSSSMRTHDVGQMDDIDGNEYYSKHLQSGNESDVSAYDSDYSNVTDFPPELVVEGGSVKCGVDKYMEPMQLSDIEGSSVDCSNNNSYSSALSPINENVMEGEIYIDQNIKFSSSVESAVASVVKELEISTSNDESSQSNACEAIFVPLKTINPNSLRNVPYTVSLASSAQKQVVRKEHNAKAINAHDTNNSSTVTKMVSKYANEVANSKNKCTLDESKGKGSYESNVQLTAAPESNNTGKEPKVVVEIAPSRDICLADIAALKNIDSGDSEKELCGRDDPATTDASFQHNSDALDSEKDSGCNETYHHVANYEEVENFCCTMRLENAHKLKYSFKKLKKRNKYGLDFRIIPGNGIRLADIKQIAIEVTEAPPEIIPVFHSILFDISGCCKTKISTSQTKKNILNFSGFPFNEHSLRFKKKRERLLRIPFQILNDICFILLGIDMSSRTEMVDKILQFLLKPTTEAVEELGKEKKKHRKNFENQESNLENSSSNSRWATENKDKESEKQITTGRKMPTEDNLTTTYKDGNRDIIKDTAIKQKILQGRVPTCHVLLERLDMTKIQKKLREAQRYSEKREREEERNKINLPSKSSFKHFNSKKKPLSKDANWMSCNKQKFKKHKQTEEISRNKVLNILEARLKGRENMVCKGSNETTDLCMKSNLEIMPAGHYVKPPYVENGSGKTLRSFPEIVLNISNANEKVIYQIHVLFYGTTDELQRSKRNILEFSGFPFSPNSWDSQKRREFFELMTPHDLRQIAKVLSIPVRDRNKSSLITTLLSFLQKPSAQFMKRNLILKKVEECERETKREIDLLKLNLKSLLKLPEDYYQPYVENPVEERRGVKLKTIANIRANVDCATPEDLHGLYDLLFIKPCENYQIHQKILEFSGFPFKEDCTEYQYRKTLLNYMSFSSVQKIANLLDLPCNNLHHCYKEDLVSTVLNFLMEPKIIHPDHQLHSITWGNSPMKMLENGMDGSQLAVDSASYENSFFNRQYSQVQKRIHCLDVNIPDCDNLNSRTPPEASYFHGSLGEQKQITNREQSHILNPRVKAISSTPFLIKKLKRADTSSSEDEVEHSVPLVAFMGHPSDNQLKQVVQEILENSIQSITMKGLIKSVYGRFPEFDLTYRKHFIKSAVRKALSKMKKNPSANSGIPFITSCQASLNKPGNFHGISSLPAPCTSVSDTSDCLVSTTVTNERILSTPESNSSNEETSIDPQIRGLLINAGVINPN